MSNPRPEWMSEHAHALVNALPASAAPHLKPIIDVLNAVAKDMASRQQAFLADALEALAKDWADGSRRSVNGCVTDLRAMVKVFREASR